MRVLSSPKFDPACLKTLHYEYFLCPSRLALPRRDSARGATGVEKERVERERLVAQVREERREDLELDLPRPSAETAQRNLGKDHAVGRDPERLRKLDLGQAVEADVRVSGLDKVG